MDSVRRERGHEMRNFFSSTSGHSAGLPIEKGVERELKKGIEKVTGKVTENKSVIMREIAKDRYITAKRLPEIVDISERKTKENIRVLKEKGLLKRIGPDRGGYWEVVDRE